MTEANSASSDEHADHDDHGHDDHDHADDEHADHDHDHGEEGHSHDFETIGAALKEITELDDDIREHLAEGDNEGAHGPLHHIGEVLEAAEKLVKEATLSDEQRESANEAIESLFASFGEIDKSFHDEEGKSYDDVSDSIKKALETLSAVSEK